MAMVPGSGDGIKKLLAAEQEAQRIIAEARKGKSDRLRQAKAEAEKEIAAYRAEREGAYQKRIAESSSGSAATFQRLSGETTIAIQKVTEDVKARKQQVVDMLVNMVSTVRFQ